MGEARVYHAAYEAGRHAAFEVDGVHRARNPGQQWTTVFDGRGFTTTPDAGGWSWGLELTSYGRAEAEHAVVAPQSVTADGSRVAYQWDELLTEWYVNDRRGLEHGYTVHARPSGMTGDLTLNLTIRGELVSAVSDDGRAVRFVDTAGGTALTYTGLSVFDADGRALAARFAPTTLGLRLTVDDSDARYPLTIDPVAQQAYLKASNTTVFNEFGRVSISGDTLVVGAADEFSGATGVNGDQGDISAFAAGAVYVFELDIVDAWIDLGQALAGTHGLPVLSGQGSLQLGNPVTLTLNAALENSTAYFVVGITSVNLPFYGGTLVPAFEPPLGLFLVLPTGPTGQLLLSDAWPSGIPSATELFFQYWITDPAGLFGFSASNAIRGTVP